MGGGGDRDSAGSHTELGNEIQLRDAGPGSTGDPARMGRHRELPVVFPKRQETGVKLNDVRSRQYYAS
jgi:hypothetical protein